MARLDRDDVAHVARLARLRLTEEELETFTVQLAAVLDHAADIEALAIDDVPPTAHPVALRNVMRADEVRPGLSPGEALAGAPDVVDGQFRVPPPAGEDR